MSYGYSANGNQNYFVGDGKRTSKVIHQPGGKSSIDLSWDEPPVPVRKSKGTPINETAGQSLEKKDSADKLNSHSIHDPRDQKRAAAGLAVSCNVYANGSNQNSGNVITDRPSSRVTQPPGGRSSIQLG